MQKQRLQASLRKTIWSFINLLPIIIGMLLLTSLVVTVFPEELSAVLFGQSDLLDALMGASVGSIAAGHPMASYLPFVQVFLSRLHRDQSAGILAGLGFGTGAKGRDKEVLAQQPGQQSFPVKAFTLGFHRAHPAWIGETKRT
jgi:hypothetical protein